MTTGTRQTKTDLLKLMNEHIDEADRLRAIIDDLKRYVSSPKFHGEGNDYVQVSDVLTRLDGR